MYPQQKSQLLTPVTDQDILRQLTCYCAFVSSFTKQKEHFNFGKSDSGARFLRTRQSFWTDSAGYGHMQPVTHISKW